MTGLLFSACIPLAALILLGFLLGKLHTIDTKSVATLAIYAITPIVAFGSVGQMEFAPELVLLPVVTFLIAAGIGLFSYWAGSRIMPQPLACLLPVATGSGNNGYFGLPVAIALFGAESAGTYFLALLGVLIYESSIGFYFVARGNLPPAQALRRVVRLPVLYALAAGLLVSIAGWDLPQAFLTFWQTCKGAYVVIGMMIAGLALAQAKGFRLHPRLLFTAMTGKFVLWPLAAVAFAWMDPGLFDDHTHMLIVTMSVMPIAGNLPAYAAANNAPIRDAAMLVLVSTIFAIIAIPLALPRFL